MFRNNCADRMKRVVAREAVLLRKTFHRFDDRFKVLGYLIFDDDMNYRMDSLIGKVNALRGVIRLHKLDALRFVDGKPFRRIGRKFDG